MVSLHTIEYYLAVKKRELLIHKMVWMNLIILSAPKSSFGFFHNILANPILIFSERSQTKRDTYCMTLST